MTADEFARLVAAFDALVVLPPPERAIAMAVHRLEHADLADRLADLLEAHDRMGEPAAEPRDDDPGIASLAPGSVVGAYQLIEKIGEGGMGEVYRARRADGTFERDVAVKITHTTLRGRHTLERFSRERTILASLDHPHIVKLLDAGVTAEGVGYFVMEYVDGVPITRHCSDRNLGLGERLQLVQRVCDAVQHAHRHAVVHRDLKPANVLVTSDGSPKVLDFGVAKVLADDVGDLRTIGVLPAPLTPCYASPEQLRGLPVTTASDVYSLGVLMYELVCGERPYETDGRPLDDVLHLVVESEPTRPSRALGTRTLGHPPCGARQLRGDIDAIVLKALAKDPAARYASPREMAEDLARVSRRRPVTARPPAPGYLFRRFVARNRALVSSAAAALLAIVTALGVAVWQWQVARVERSRAERRFSEVRQIANKVLFDYQAALRSLRGASDLRARMAADSLAYLDALSTGRADDALLLEMARGYLAIAEVQGSSRSNSVGNVEAAMTSLDRAAAILDDLAGRRTELDAAAEVRAQAGCTAARIDTSRARVHARACVEALKPLVTGRRPTDPLVLRLGDALSFLVEAGDLDHVDAARAIFEPLVDDPVVGRRARFSLGLLHRLVGWAAVERGDAREAVVHGERAFEVMAPVVAAEPRAAGLEHAFTLQLLGRARIALGERRRGQEALAKAVSLLQTAYEDNSGDAWVQDRLVTSWFDLAVGMDATDRPAVARIAGKAADLMPRLTLSIPSPVRHQARGFLLAAHARLNFDRPPCDMVSTAVDHFDAARRSESWMAPVPDYADWAARALASCRGAH
jgi:serine/threonine protein kinase